MSRSRVGETPLNMGITQKLEQNDDNNFIISYDDGIPSAHTASSRSFRSVCEYCGIDNNKCEDLQ